MGVFIKIDDLERASIRVYFQILDVREKMIWMNFALGRKTWN